MVQDIIMAIQDDELEHYIRKVVRDELTARGRLIISEIMSKGGGLSLSAQGKITLNARGNIDLKTEGNSKALYNGTEIGITSGTIGGSGTAPYLAKFTASSTIGNSTIKDSGGVFIENNLTLYKSGGSNYILTFQHPTGGSAQKAQILLFTGYTAYDFLINAAGRMRLQATDGIELYSNVLAYTMAGAIAMGSNKITGLAAASANGDAVRYEQLFGVYLPLAGGTMAGAIAMGGYGITGTGDITPTTTDTKSLGTSTYWWNNLHTQFIYIDDSDTVISNNNGDMQFNVASGKKFKFVVG